MEIARSNRRYDIDWLRVFATYLLLPFHVGMVFNPAPFYHIRNGDVSFVFLILCGFIGLWHTHAALPFARRMAHPRLSFPSCPKILSSPGFTP